MPKMLENIINNKILVDASQLEQQSGVVATAWNRQGDAARKAGQISSGAMAQFSIAASAAAAAVGFAFKSVTDQFIEFDRKMALVRAVTDASDSSFQRLSDQARELGAATEFGAAKAAEAMLVFARIGYDAGEIFQLLTPTIKLATATQHDFQASAELVSATIKAYGLDVSEADRVTNNLAATSSKTAADMEKLQTALQYIAPVAKSLDISLEETNAALGMLFNAGMKASRAGTSLRFAFATLLDPSEQAMRAIDQLGLDINKLNPATNSLSSILKELAKSYNKVGKPAEQFYAIFGKRASSAMLNLSSAVHRNARSFDDVVEKISDTNEVTRQFEQQMNTISGQFLRVKSLTQEVAIGLGESMVPAFKLVGNVLENMLIGFRESPKVMKTFIGATGASVTAVVGLIATFASLGWVIRAVSIGFKSLAASVGVLLNPYVALAAVAAALAASFVSIVGESERLKKKHEEEQKEAQKLAETYVKLKQNMDEARKKGEDTAVIEEKLSKTTYRLGTLLPDLIDKYSLLNGQYKLIEERVGNIAAGSKNAENTRREEIEKTVKEIQTLNHQLKLQEQNLAENIGMLERWRDAQAGKITKTPEMKAEESGILSAAVATGEAFEGMVPIYEKTNRKIAEKLADLNTQLIEARNKLDKLQKGIKDDTKDNFEDLEDEFGEGGDKVTYAFEKFIEYMQDLRRRYEEETNKLSKTGYEADIEGIRNAESQERDSMQRRYNEFMITLEKEVRSRKKTRDQANAEAEAAQKELDATTDASHAKATKKIENLDNKYFDDYVDMLNDIEVSIQSHTNEINSMCGDSLQNKLDIITAEEKAELESLAKRERKIRKTYTGKGKDGEQEISEEGKKLLEKTEDEKTIITNAAIKKRKQARLESWMDEKELEIDSVDNTKKMELKKASDILKIRKQIVQELKNQNKEQTEDYKDALKDMEQAQRDVTTAQLNLAVNTINIINRVVDSSVAELAGLEDDASNTFKNIGNLLIDVFTGNWINVLFDVVNIIAGGILKAREEEKRLEEERIKNVINQIKYARELRKEIEQIEQLRNQSLSLTKSISEYQKDFEAVIDAQVSDLLAKAPSRILANTIDTWESAVKKLAKLPADQKDSLENLLKSMDEVSGLMHKASKEGNDPLAQAYYEQYDMLQNQTRILAKSLGFTAAEASEFGYMFRAATDRNGRTMNEAELALRNFAFGVFESAEIIGKSMETINKEFKNISDLEFFKDKLFELANVTGEVREGLTSDIIATAEKIRDAQLAQAELLGDPEMARKAWQSFADTISKILDDPRFADQLTPFEQFDLQQIVDNVGDNIEEAVDDITDKLVDEFSNMLSELDNLFDDYADSFDKSLSMWQNMYDKGYISFEEFLGAIDNLSTSVSEDIPEDIAEGIRNAVGQIEFDAVTNALEGVTDRLENISDELRGLYGELAEATIEQAALTSERALLVKPDVELNPEDFEFDPEILARGFTPFEQIAIIQRDLTKNLASIDDAISESGFSIRNYQRLIENLPASLTSALTEMNAEFDVAASEARDNSEEKQREMIEDRFRLLTDFAFNESQNERSNRMRRIRELDDALEKERNALEAALTEIEEKRIASDERIRAENKKLFYDYIYAMNDEYEKLGKLEKDRMNTVLKAESEIAVIDYNRLKRLEEIENKLGSISSFIFATNQMIGRAERARTDLAIEQNDLQEKYNELRDEDANRSYAALRDETAIRGNLVADILPKQQELMQRINELSYEQLDVLRQQRDIWDELNNMLPGIESAYARIVESATLLPGLNLTAAQAEDLPPWLQKYLPSEYQNIPTAQKGMISNKEQLVHVHPNEAIMPLSHLPAIMERLTNKLPISGGRTVILNMNDTIDLRGSISAINNKNDVDKLYRDVIIPAKRRNLERFKNILTEEIR